MAVHDGRARASVCLSKSELTALAERIESKRLARTRSVYLALVEAVGEQWSRGDIAARAGVSTALLKETIQELELGGFVRYREDEALVLNRAEDLGPAPQLPVTTEAQLKEPDEEAAAMRKRCEAFHRFHASLIQEHAGGKVPAKTADALAAARKILEREPDSTVIRARLQYALGHRFYADKVLTLMNFERWWPRISAAHTAESRGGGVVVVPPEFQRTNFDPEHNAAAG